MRIPAVKARRGYRSSDVWRKGRGLPHYSEGDRDYVANNFAVAVWLLENRDRIAAALKKRGP